MSSPSNPDSSADNRRFPLIPSEQLTSEQKVLVEAIRSGPRAQIQNSGASKPGPIGGPFNVWLRSPGIGDKIQQLGEEIRFRSSLPSKLNEMAILVTARVWKSQYEWFAHHKLAVAAGLDPQIGKDIAEGKRPTTMSDEEAIIYDFSLQMHETHGVDDKTYQRAIQQFGERGVMDLMAVNGFYCLVSMCLNVDRTPLPVGEPLPLK
jgi:4-carboxymuconolactone decarboxylase